MNEYGPDGTKEFFQLGGPGDPNYTGTPQPTQGVAIPQAPQAPQAAMPRTTRPLGGFSMANFGSGDRGPARTTRPAQPMPQAPQAAQPAASGGGAMQSVTDPYTGMTYQVPRFGVRTTLSPQQQRIKDQNDAASLNLATLGNNLSGTLGEKLTGNFTINNEATEARLFDLGSRRLNPMFARQDEELRTRLANQGIRAGSEAYDREMRTFNEGKNDAFNGLMLQGRGQAVQEQLTEDNQRINQISALLGGGQVSMPQFMTGAGIGAIPTTDNASIIANNDNARMASWQQSQAAMGSAIGGLGGLFALSDPKAKTDKQKIAETSDGMGIYSFKYKGSPKTEIGLMADEVKRKKPSAVRKGQDGLMRVNYGEALK